MYAPTLNFHANVNLTDYDIIYIPHYYNIHVHHRRSISAGIKFEKKREKCVSWKREKGYV